MLWGLVMADTTKPAMVLLNGQKMTFEDIVKLTKKITGRQPTPEELADARKDWDALVASQRS